MTNSSPPAAPPDWTLGRMAFQLSEPVEAYLLEHSNGYAEVAAALAAETTALGDPAVMMLAKEQYALFHFLCGLLRCRRALDIGTFTGMSALAFAAGMGPDGRVVTIDRTRAWLDIAQRHWHALGVADRVDARIGEAAAVLRDLAATPEQRFDIAFLDVDKARVQEYFDATLELMRPQGLILVDNTLWHGWVLDNAHEDPDTTGMRAFNEQVARDARVEVVILPVGDGLSLIRRLR
jgi:predicted O-methyltransferase YrrM